MAILLGGLLCVAMLIPVGKLAMTAANRSDRTGACGRAALHDIKVRDARLDRWSWNPRRCRTCLSLIRWYYTTNATRSAALPYRLNSTAPRPRVGGNRQSRGAITFASLMPLTTTRRPPNSRTTLADQIFRWRR